MLLVQRIYRTCDGDSGGSHARLKLSGRILSFLFADQSPRTRYLYFQNSIRAGIVDELAQSLV